MVSSSPSCGPSTKPDKVKVVFDCTVRFQNTSLKDQELQGPDLTNSIVGVPLPFRQERIGISTDIEKMFHQVNVSPQDMHALSLLCWPGGNFSKETEDHQMLVHFFGAKSSPSCTSFPSKKTGGDNRKYLVKIIAPYPCFPLFLKFKRGVWSPIWSHMSRRSLYTYQHGFQKRKSCVTQLLEVFHEIGCALHRGFESDIIYLDFAKAFDSVCPAKLVSKLKAFGIGDPLL